MYYAVIGDIVHSKDINHAVRNDVQKKLKMILDGINKQFGKDIAAKFIVTIGDEFQGLINNPMVVLSIVDTIRYKMYPVIIRFGIGIGGIDTEINKEMALGANGPAYHNARNMVDHIKLLEKGKLSPSANILFMSSWKEHNNIISLMNNNLQLCAFIESKWTDKQRDLVERMFLGGKNQTEAAAELGIAQSSVQRRLKSAGYYDYMYARDIISVTLNGLSGEAVRVPVSSSH